MTARLEKRKYKTDLTVKQWEILKPLIPPAKHGGRPRKHNMKSVIDAILYKVKTGCHWYLLPNDYPPYKTVFDYFRRWSLDGTWEKLHNEIRSLARKKKKKRASFCCNNR